VIARLASQLVALWLVGWRVCAAAPVRPTRALMEAILRETARDATAC